MKKRMCAKNEYKASSKWALQIKSTYTMVIVKQIGAQFTSCTFERKFQFRRVRVTQKSSNLGTWLASSMMSIHFWARVYGPGSGKPVRLPALASNGQMKRNRAFLRISRPTYCGYCVKVIVSSFSISLPKIRFAYAFIRFLYFSLSSSFLFILTREWITRSHGAFC